MKFILGVMQRYVDVCRSMQRCAEVHTDTRRYEAVCRGMQRYTEGYAEVHVGMQRYAEVYRSVHRRVLFGA